MKYFEMCDIENERIFGALTALPLEIKKVILAEFIEMQRIWFLGGIKFKF